MLSLVVLISGGGSNLRALLEASEDAEFPARVVAVGADRPADGFEHAEEFGIPTFSAALSIVRSTARRGATPCSSRSSVWQPDLVVLSGFMKLLPPRVVDALSPMLINTHPAYLPEFPGAHGVRDALAAGVSRDGCERHRRRQRSGQRPDHLAAACAGARPATPRATCTSASSSSNANCSCRPCSTSPTDTST